jgi:hypothetical protein
VLGALASASGKRPNAVRTRGFLVAFCLDAELPGAQIDEVNPMKPPTSFVLPGWLMQKSAFILPILDVFSLSN